ncbi:hypothetical protein [Shewanella litoralis]|uniref:Uncharacterized protein n=1 Tax=Shewanella litoralis TaxID=2282700 RepID=A0ABQ2RF46_9GAMM|nr:hypothetical protein [Shewanella litoralis]GGQ22835.1 hypothetical protein GCM10009411_23600 [Shewanella litoralis]
MENIIDMQGLHLSHSNEDRCYFITSQRNLMSFLGAGMIVPASSQFRYKEDSRQRFDGLIPFWKGGIPALKESMGWVDRKRMVVLEYYIDDIRIFADNFIVAENINLMVVNAPIPLLNVVTVYLDSDEEIKDFVMRLPSDVIVESKLFKALPSFKPIYEEPLEEMKGVVDIAPKVSFIDSFGGGVRALNHLNSLHLENNSYLSGLLLCCLDHYGYKALCSPNSYPLECKTEISDSAKCIIHRLLPILQGVKVEEGYDQFYILERLEASLHQEGENFSAEVDEWLTYVRRVLEADIEAPVLADDGDLFKRAILLFLLRPNLSRLKGSADSAISPGPIVLSIAVFFAGYTDGLCRLDAEYKGHYEEFNQFAKLLIDSLWNNFEVVINISCLQQSDNSSSLIYELNNQARQQVFSTKFMILDQVFNLLKLAGYELIFDRQKQELLYDFNLEGGRHQVVYIEMMKPKVEGLNIVKIVSPCLDLSGSKLKSLTKNVAVDFLKRNSSDSMFCSFAFSEKRQAIVAQSLQVVNTLNGEDLIAFLKHIAEVADEFERDILGKDYF